MSATDRLPYRPFSLSVVPNRSQVDVVPEGELDLDSAGALEREVRELCRSGFDRIVIDLRRVEFMDSMGLRALLRLREDAKREEPSLVLIPGPAPVQRLFELTGTRGLFDWRDT